MFVKPGSRVGISEQTQVPDSRRAAGASPACWSASSPTARASGIWRRSCPR